MKLTALACSASVARDRGLLGTFLDQILDACRCPPAGRRPPCCRARRERSACRRSGAAPRYAGRRASSRSPSCAARRRARRTTAPRRAPSPSAVGSVKCGRPCRPRRATPGRTGRGRASSSRKSCIAAVRLAGVSSAGSRYQAPSRWREQVGAARAIIGRKSRCRKPRCVVPMNHGSNWRGPRCCSGRYGRERTWAAGDSIECRADELTKRDCSARCWTKSLPADDRTSCSSRRSRTRTSGCAFRRRGREAARGAALLAFVDAALRAVAAGGGHPLQPQRDVPEGRRRRRRHRAGAGNPPGRHTVHAEVWLFSHAAIEPMLHATRQASSEGLRHGEAKSQRLDRVEMPVGDPRGRLARQARRRRSSRSGWPWC